MVLASQLDDYAERFDFDVYESLLFFVLLILSCLVYAAEKRSILGAASFAIGLSVWILYGAGLIHAGIAVPEIISVAAATSWVVPEKYRKTD
jgi:hypothetical membrane protein